MAGRLPYWDADEHKLFFGNVLVKQFHRPADNQERILATFQQDGWPAQIDDPLPGDDAVDAKRRLHDTIKQLNRNQKNPVLRFRGVGNGEAVAWERKTTAQRQGGGAQTSSPRSPPARALTTLSDLAKTQMSLAPRPSPSW